MLSRVEANNFTIFKQLNLSFSKGINVFIGKNGTGKTHLMKALYASCCLIDHRERKTLEQKLYGVFLPKSIGRLVHKQQGVSNASLTIYRNTEEKEKKISIQISSNNRTTLSELNTWQEDVRFQAVYIPVKDMLANAPGFRALYNNKYLHVEEVYADIIDKALLPPPRGKVTGERQKLMNELVKVLEGKVVEKNESFFLKNNVGELEFTLLAEGYRKLGLLYKLIQNESLAKGSVLFWDEPEANLNPILTKAVVRILLRLSDMGTQIFVSTHNYALLKNFDLESAPNSVITYHAFYHNASQEVVCQSSTSLVDITHNAIDEAYEDLLERSLQKKMSYAF